MNLRLEREVDQQNRSIFFNCLFCFDNVVNCINGWPGKAFGHTAEYGMMVTQIVNILSNKIWGGCARLHSTRLHVFESQPPHPLILLIRDAVLIALFSSSRANFRSQFCHTTLIWINLPNIHGSVTCYMPPITWIRSEFFQLFF
jgi:hypothetical protein